MESEIKQNPQNHANNPNKNPWLNAWHDPLANLKTLSACVRMGDIYGDGDAKLVICDLDKKVKIYKGTALATEVTLLDAPVAMCITYSDLATPRVPNLAIAAGSHVFLYRQLRPYRKWTCPPVDIAQAEADVWSALRNDSMSVSDAMKALTEIRDSGSNISHRSVELLSLDSDLAKSNFVEEMKNVQYVQPTLITCMEEIKKDSDDIDALTLLAVGTESKQFYILPQDPSNSTFLCKVQLPAVPVMITISGQFDIEWRAYVACRDGRVYVIKNGEVRGTAALTGTVIDLCSQVVAMAKQDKLLWIATMDRTVACYSARGKRTKSIILNEDVTEICIIAVRRAKVSHLLLVALANGEVRMYRDSAQVLSFNLERPVVAFRYGSYGREDGTLVCVHGRGSLTIKIWRRAVDADNLVALSGPPPEQDIPLPVPKKTKVYVEQTQREREQAGAMHRAFQKDLCRLRLETARAYVKTLTDGYMGSTPMGSSDIRLQAQALGLGPLFVLKVTIQNAGSHPLYQTRMMFTFDINMYKMGHDTESQQCVLVPVLLPGVKHVLEVKILSIDAQGRSGQVMVILQHASSTSTMPLLSATVKMPVSEPLSI